MNLIKWQPKATKQLRKIEDNKLRQQIYDAVQLLKNFPQCTNVKKLNNHANAYRLRIGIYRVFFDFDGTVKIISIEEVKKRNEHTY